MSEKLSDRLRKAAEFCEQRAEVADDYQRDTVTSDALTDAASFLKDAAQLATLVERWQAAKRALMKPGEYGTMDQHIESSTAQDALLAFDLGVPHE